MKTELEVLDVESTLDGEWVNMTIDPNSLTHIMNVLTNLYSDPELAVIREYSTNAFDAHVEALEKRPIEVTLPTNLSPFFKVRDYGFGLNAQDIRDIYSQYGTSTKRSSNDVVGMLGLGCKSGLTYTDQFTVTGVKDGIATHVSITRDMDGGGSMVIVDEYKTNDPSGVEIVIPAKQHNRFAEKASAFFRFWQDGTVLVDGQAPKRVEGINLTDDLLLTRDVDRNMIVMGNVAYPMDDNTTSDQWDEDAGRYINGYSLVAYVNIGDVNFTPSREALHMTKKTKATIADIKQRATAAKKDAVTKSVNEAKTHYEALELFLTTARTLGVDGVKYKGQDFPEQFKPEDNAPMFITKRHVGNSYTFQKPNQVRQLVATTWRNDIFFVGFDGTAISPYKRKKLDQWFSKLSDDAKNALPTMGYNHSRYWNVVVVKELPTEVAQWINPAFIFNWAEVEAEKIVRENSVKQNGRPTGSYTGYTASGYSDTIKAEDIDTSKPIFWAPLREENSGVSAIRAAHPDATILVLGGNRVTKFLRDFPTAKKTTDVLAAEAKTWLANLSDDDKAVLGMGNYMRNYLRSFKDEQIDDPDVAEAVRQALLSYDKLNKLYSGYQSWLPYGAIKDFKDPLVKYPLLTQRRYYDTLSPKAMKHAVLYINAAYAASQEGDK